jgi:hypothetical protein
MRTLWSAELYTLSRRRFDHLVAEISRAVGTRVPRFSLWLRFHEHGCNPETLTARMALAFCDGPLAGFLAEYDLRLSRRAKRRLCRAIEGYDPSPPHTRIEVD